MKTPNFRETTQYIIPTKKPLAKPGNYDIYPAHNLGEGKIFRGYEKLAREILQHHLQQLKHGDHGGTRITKT